MVILPSLFVFLLLNFHGIIAMKNEPLIISMPTNKLQTYIVHVKKPEMGVLGETPIALESWHMSFLEEAAATSIYNESPYLLYSYRNVMSGFSARLTPEQVKSMEKKDGFISAIPDSFSKLHTTHTPSYLGLNTQSGFWRDSKFGRGVIIGVLDTGVTPGHISFNDAGMPPPPAKWKGRCELQASQCNNRLIGARVFNLANKLMDGESAVDENGHGTHCASTAAGAAIHVQGLFNGTAIGIAPSAHLAVYKVCSRDGLCWDSDILAGLDAAIDDGVDVLSLSFGRQHSSFINNAVAIGTHAAVEKGIFVSCSAGNDGPSKSTIHNDAPWILTVAASTIDRRIVVVVKLGNGEEYEGESLFQAKNYSSPFLSLVYPGQNGNQAAASCDQGSLNNIDVRGKIVVCEFKMGTGNVQRGIVVRNAGGAGMILINQQPMGFTTLAENHVLPTSHITYVDGLKIKSYLLSAINPSASIIFKGTIINSSSVYDPALAYFSSRGPSITTPGILKPDITGPGVNILAAWSTTTTAFDVLYGTSMSCPHLSGIAALIKSYRPEWSPAAIKSAIMTNADIKNSQDWPILDQELKPASFFAMGAGHVNPTAAADPGLVYDIQPDGYIPYLCGLYKDEEVSIIVRKTIVCSSISKIAEGELNYPSFSVALRLSQTQTFSRTVTNVGAAKSVYSVNIDAPRGVIVNVLPRTLSFSEVNQKLIYTVTFSRSILSVSGQHVEGYIKWVSDKYVVRSPISVNLIN